MYPFTNTIGQMKVSQALPLLGFIAQDYKLDLAILPISPNRKNIHLVVWRRHQMKISTRILKNSQRNN